MKNIKNALKAIHKVIDAIFSFVTTNVATISLIWIFVAFIICIFYRYIAIKSIGPLEESNTIALVYLSLFGAAYSFKAQSNTSFDLLYDMLGNRAKAAIDILAKVTVTVTFCILLNPIWEDILFYDMRKTSLLKVSYMIVYMPFMLILLGGIYYNTYYIFAEHIPALIGRKTETEAPVSQSTEGK